MKLDWMQTILAGALVVVVISFWRAHRRKDVSFNLTDLIMIEGKVDRIAAAFMLVLGVSTWVVVDLQIKGHLTEGYFTIYTGAWILPLVAKVVFNRTDMPGTTVQSTTTTTSTVKEPPHDPA